MKMSTALLAITALLTSSVLGPPRGSQTAGAEAGPAAAEAQAKRKQDERRSFQSQELMTAARYNWIFNLATPPRIIWRDVDEVRRLGCDGRLRVRWFNAALNEVVQPNESGRWLAWIEGTAPNGTPLRRALTFYALPKIVPLQGAPEFSVSLPRAPGTLSPDVWREHQAELSKTLNDVLLRAILDSQHSAVLVAALADWKPLGRPARAVDSAAVLNEDGHLALKLKLQGLDKQVRTLQPPRRRKTPATVLHEGTCAEAGMKPDARAKIESVCRAWADDTGEPMVTLVARCGVIVVHQAFGKDAAGKAVTRDYRCEVASITKTVTALLFSRFLDQGLIQLDDPVGKFFPDYPRNDPHVPTFRQCFNHTSGLSGHGDFDGCRNPHFENVVLNGIDVNQPGAKYSYSGMGFDLAVKAMEIVGGRSAVRLYDEHLFRPLGCNDVPMEGAAAGGHFTAKELGVLAQWVANRGSYGELEFIAPATFDKLLPEPITAADRGFVEDEGIGMHWVRHRKPGAPPNSKAPEHLLFGPRTLGHGSFTGCVFVVDPDQQLIITQVRRSSGPRSDQWSPRFFQAIAEGVSPAM
jgi:CubicO group peptidase (beta-lactamase class C family)